MLEQINNRTEKTKSCGHGNNVIWVTLPPQWPLQSPLYHLSCTLYDYLVQPPAVEKWEESLGLLQSHMLWLHGARR